MDREVLFSMYGFRQERDDGITLRVILWVVRFFWYRKRANDFGLFWSPGILSGLRPKILKFPIEFMADFADATCRALVINDELKIAHFVNDFGEDGSPLPEPFRYQNINTTGIGNLAYIAVNHHSDEFVKKALVELVKIKLEDAGLCSE